MSPKTPAYSWYALGILSLVNLFHVVDRQVFSVLQDSIKADLHLSDTVLGLLSGLAFALFYVILGVPIAKLADRKNRTRIIAAALGLWSVMTGLCGFATSAVALGLARLGVGVGEAGCLPATHSLISDFFPPHRRATAFAILTAGTSAGVSLGFFMGGFLDQSLGWRRALLWLGAPGLVFAIVLLFVLREPPRGQFDAKPLAVTGRQPNDFGQLWRIPTFRYVLIAYALHFLTVQGTGAWKASYFRRAFDAVDKATIGGALGVAALLGVVGILLGGILSDRLAKADARWLTRMPIISILLAMPFFIAMLFVTDWRVAVACYTFDVGLNAAFTGPTLATLQRLTPAPLRAFSASVVLLAVSLIGMGLGPLAVGALSDALSPALGTQGLRFALLSAPLINVLAIVFYAVASGRIREDLATAET